MTIEQDKIFASKVCAGDKKAQEEFYQLICDQLYNRADKLNNLGIRKGVFTSYRTKTGYTIKVNEEVQDLFTWLWEREVKLTCKYEGLAPLINLINHDIFNDLTRKNWIRHKRGKDAYIPTIIKKFSKLHIDIFKQLTYKKTNEEIIERLQIEPSEFNKCFEEILEALKRAGMLRLIYSEKKISLNDYEPSPADVKDAPGFYTRNSPMDYEAQIKYLEKKIMKICLLLDKQERRLLGLYWGHEFTPKEILTFLTETHSSYLVKFNIKNEVDIQSKISKISYKLFTYSKEKSKSFFEENGINQKRFKKLLKYHFLYKDPKKYT